VIVTGIDMVKLFRTAGDGREGETVTHLEHALQCAALARRDRADDEVVVAALLHDVGHLWPLAADERAQHHGRRGAELLRPFVPARVAWLVEHHVVAKRYLCTVGPRYATRLSPASARSLARQGATLESEERRRWDDAAKIPDAVCPPLADYRPLLERWLGPQSWLGADVL
jgi:[1-hydroxy-2-(trimethylamino)ethyl]phosphonate dioxygenase